MILLHGIRPLFYGAQIIGCPPHLITEKGLIVTKWGLLYTFLILGIYLYAFYQRVYSVMVYLKDFKFFLLITVRTILAFMCYFVDVILTLVWNEKLQLVLSQIQKFDLAVSYQETQKRKIRNSCWAIVVIVVAFWLTSGYLTLVSETEDRYSISLTYIFVYMATGMQSMKFVGFLFLIHRRFRHLNEMLMLEDVSISGLIRGHNQVQLQDVWWLHGCLSDASETINGVYSMQLLLWIMTCSLNAISRIYNIIENEMMMSLLKYREIFMVISCVTTLLSIIISCHFTMTQANKIGSTIFSPKSVLSRIRSRIEDNVEVGLYFQLRQLEFSAAAGFIRVDLPLLLSIAAAMTTYLVILHATKET